MFYYLRFGKHLEKRRIEISDEFLVRKSIIILRWLDLTRLVHWEGQRSEAGVSQREREKGRQEHNLETLRIEAKWIEKKVIKGVFSWYFRGLFDAREQASWAETLTPKVSVSFLFIFSFFFSPFHSSWLMKNHRFRRRPRVFVLWQERFGSEEFMRVQERKDGKKLT